MGVIPEVRQDSVKTRIAGYLPEFNLPVVGKWRAQYVLIQVVLAFLHFAVVIGLAWLVIFQLMPVAQRLKWVAFISEDMFKLFWLLLSGAIFVFIRILTEPIFWHDRQQV